MSPCDISLFFFVFSFFSSFPSFPKDLDLGDIFYRVDSPLPAQNVPNSSSMSELDSSDNKDDHVVGEIVIHPTFLACADFNLDDLKGEGDDDSPSSIVTPPMGKEGKDLLVKAIGVPLGLTQLFSEWRSKKNDDKTVALPGLGDTVAKMGAEATLGKSVNRVGRRRYNVEGSRRMATTRAISRFGGGGDRRRVEVPQRKLVVFEGRVAGATAKGRAAVLRRLCLGVRRPSDGDFQVFCEVRLHLPRWVILSWNWNLSLRNWYVLIWLFASAHDYIKSLSENSLGTEIASRSCFLLEDPPDAKKEISTSEGDFKSEEDQSDKNIQHDTTMLDDKDLEDDHQKTKIASDASADKIHLASTNGLPEKSTSKEQAIISHESGLNKCDDPCVSKANQRIERPQSCHIRAKTVMT
ncbi:hypothetical protein KIW84_010673 [Lathyrus oleraceus]|uniref:Uncharacterized protein n=1 Tax=Pisum sativum TaxID=3888 RepID=A0A9D4YKL8_PEA|nr:hypothetical protein KIW84_010673 [Pisum sativum]